MIAVIIAIIFSWMFWRDIAWGYKLALTIFIAVCTFSLADLKALTKSYEKYKHDWEESNKKIK